MSATAWLLKPDTPPTLISLPKDDPFKAIQNAVGGWVVQMPLILNLGNTLDFVMYVDEEGSFPKDLPVNETASRFAHPTYGPVVGNAVLVKEKTDADGDSTYHDVSFTLPDPIAFLERAER